MSQDIEKPTTTTKYPIIMIRNKLEKLTWGLTKGAFLTSLVLTAIFVVAVTGYEDRSNVQEDENAFYIQQGYEHGYSWNESNLTTFEKTIGGGLFTASTSIAESQCANGIAEGCDYLTIKEEADSMSFRDRNNVPNWVYMLSSVAVRMCLSVPILFLVYHMIKPNPYR